MPHDAELPSVSVLLGPGASAAVAPAVEGDGGAIQSLKPRFVMYTPGERVAVRYSARVEWPDGSVTDTTIVGTERSGGAPAGSIPVEVADTTIGVWRWPDDPRLPGLRHATNPEFVRGLLDHIGADPGRVKLSTRAYWPGRRAVVQAVIPPSGGLSFDPGTKKLRRASSERLVFIKVVRPKDVERLWDVHAALLESLPVARPLSWSRDYGLLMIEALPGQTISGCLDSGAAPPPGDALLELLARLAPFDLGGEPRRTTAGKIRTHVRLLKAVLPEESERLDRFAETYGEEREQPLVTVHGDFHEEQVLAEGGRITGLLDVDDVGPGQLVDDLALMIGRVRARAHFAKRNGKMISAYEQHLLDRFSRAVDPGELRHRAAGALLGRATAPFRGQARGWQAESRQRLDMAEDWLQRWARESG